MVGVISRLKDVDYKLWFITLQDSSIWGLGHTGLSYSWYSYRFKSVFNVCVIIFIFEINNYLFMSSSVIFITKYVMLCRRLAHMWCNSVPSFSNTSTLRLPIVWLSVQIAF